MFNIIIIIIIIPIKCTLVFIYNSTLVFIYNNFQHVLATHVAISGGKNQG